MNASALVSEPLLPLRNDGLLLGRNSAWFAFTLTFLLMLFDHMDRQIIVSLFPHIKAEWNLSDKQLGGLVSIVSIVVAIGGIPVAMLADRTSRVKSIFVMATTWSLASVSCMFASSYAQLLAARAMVGAGEAGYGSVGAALISSLFPQRLRAAVLGAYFAAASLGSVLGVVLGGVVAARWGWKAAFGVVGVPGLLLALLYLRVRDYQTVERPAAPGQSATSIGAMLRQVLGTLARTRTLLWCCTGAALQLIVVSAVWSWLPSYLIRFHGTAAELASRQAALVALLGALGSVFWGFVVDRVVPHQPSRRLVVLSVLCIATTLLLIAAFAGVPAGPLQLRLVMVGGFFMTCTVGVVASVAMDVIHPSVRSTGSAVVSLFQNLFGLAIGPFLAGVLSDLWGLQQAMVVIPLFSVLAAATFVFAARHYDHDAKQIADAAAVPVRGDA